MRWSHSWHGVFLLCLPVGMAALWLFHAVMKKPLVALAPEFVRTRIANSDLDSRFGPLPRFAWILVSMLVGIIGHVLLDGFTHDHGYFVKHWPLLSIPVETYRVMPLWRVLQQALSVVGVGIVALVTIWWWYRKPVVEDPVSSDMTPRLRWFVIGVMALLAILTGAAVGLSAYSSFHHQWKTSLIKGVVGTLSAACAEMILFSLVWQWNRKTGRNEKPPDHRVQRLEVTTPR